MDITIVAGQPAVPVLMVVLCALIFVILAIIVGIKFLAAIAFRKKKKLQEQEQEQQERRQNLLTKYRVLALDEGNLFDKDKPHARKPTAPSIGVIEQAEGLPSGSPLAVKLQEVYNDELDKHFKSD